MKVQPLAVEGKEHQENFINVSKQSARVAAEHPGVCSSSSCTCCFILAGQLE